MSDKPRNLHQRIIAVMQQVKYVRKDVTVNAGAGGKYPGVSHDAVASILHGALADNGIVMRVTQDSSQTLEGQTKSGSPKIRYSGWYEVALINADDPQDRETYRVEAHAEDSGDKAPGKALSYAVKMILLKAFVLETGDSCHYDGRLPHAVENCGNVTARVVIAMTPAAFEPIMWRQYRNT